MKNQERENKQNKTYIVVATIVGIAILGFGILNFISEEKNRQLEQIKTQKQTEIETRRSLSLNECLNEVEKEEDSNYTSLLDWAKEGNKDGKYDLSNAFEDIKKIYEQGRENCFRINEK